MQTGSESIDQQETRIGGIVIRATEPSDADMIADIMNLPGVRHGTLTTPFRSAETMTRWLNNKPAGSIQICALVDGKVVGHAGFTVTPPRRAHSAELGISVHDGYQGRGVGTALLKALVECADRSLGLRRLSLTVYVDNVTAIALYRQFGFAEEGRSRGYAMRDGKLADALHMARLVDAPAFAHPRD